MKQALDYLTSFTVLALIVAGLTGFAYHLFREDGWAEAVTGTMWSATMRSPLMALVVITGVAALVGLWWRNRRIRRDPGNAATVAFYVMIVAGVYFLGRLVLLGTL